jgi:NTE family protein
LQGISKLVHTARAFRRELARTRETAPALPKIGIALGGGFARGLCHIGVIKVLEEEKVPIDYVAGTSVGAVIGAAYCSGMSVKELEEIAALVRFGDFARWTLSRYGVASNDRMKGFLKKLLKCKTFEELRIPLAVAATDFVTGDGVVFRSGELVDAVRASCAYPGMFLPVNVNGRLLVDGLLAHAVPAGPLKEMGAERVVAIYLSAHWVHLKGPRHVFDVIGQCFSIAQEKMCHVWKAHADITLEPNVAGFTYDGFDRAADLIKVGEAAARAALPEIKAWLPQESAAAGRKRKSSGVVLPQPSPAQP